VARGKKEPDLSQLTREQRARVEAATAERQRQLDEAEEEWRKLDEIEAARRAALVVEDDSPLPPTAADRRAVAEGVGHEQLMRETLQRSKSELWATWSPRTLLRGLANDMSEQNFGRSLSDGRSPQERQQLAAAEWEARRAARAHYRAPQPPQVRISRIATRGKRQLDEVRAWLAATGLAARPDLVWSVHRVPDRISPNVTAHSESGRVVEWEVVHQPVALPPTEAPVAFTSFDRRNRWIARRLGDPVPLDEDVGAWFAGWAELDPAQCFGMPRILTLRSYGGGAGESASGSYASVVAGISVLHAPSRYADHVRQHMEADRPVAPPPGPGALRVDRLDWAALAEHVHPVLLGTPTVPSPKPRLPSSPQELLLAYIEVVGITSVDCVSAAVTTGDRNVQQNLLGLGPAHPVADGKARRRAHLAREIVLVYRDRPEYAAGRDRWSAYQAEVLRARPAHLTEKRDVLDVPSRADNLIDTASNLVEAVTSPLDWLDWAERDKPPFVPFPYCWPPVA
jgi:hypothetical protein